MGRLSFFIFLYNLLGGFLGYCHRREQNGIEGLLFTGHERRMRGAAIKREIFGKALGLMGKDSLAFPQPSSYEI